MNDEKDQTDADNLRPKPDNVGEERWGVVEVEVIGRRRDRVEIEVPARIAVMMAGDRDSTRIVPLGL